MRTIRFRGKDAKTGGWRFGSHVVYNMPDPVDEGQPTQGFQEVHYIFSSVHAFGCDDLQYEVLCTTVGQFTGRHDRKGHEIYEGDIIKFHEEMENGVVVYDERKALFGLLYDDPYNPLVYGLYDCKEQELEIIGNIHDNQK